MRMRSAKKWSSIVILAVIVAVLIVPILPVNGGRNSGEVFGATTAEAGRVKDGPQGGDGDLVEDGPNVERIKPDKLSFADGAHPEISDHPRPSKQIVLDPKAPHRDMRVTGTCGTIDFRMGAVPKEELGTTQNGVTWVIVVESTLGPVAYAQYQIAFSREDQDGNGNPIKYPDTRTGWIQNYPPFPNYAVVLPQGFAATGDGKVIGNLEGQSLIYLGGDPTNIQTCTWRDNWEVAFPGYRKSNDPRDPLSGFQDLLPPTGDSTLGSSKFPDPDNKHCESCDKDADAAQEQAMFNTRDKICEPLRYLGFNSLSFKACKRSGLFAIRASESNTANVWTRWTDTNRNGWRGPSDFTTTSVTVDGYTFTKLGNVQPAWACYSCTPQRLHLQSSYSAYGTIQTSRPPADNTSWRANPESVSPLYPELCDWEFYPNYPLYTCQQWYYGAKISRLRPPAEDGSGGGPKAAPEWVPTQKGHGRHNQAQNLGLRFSLFSDIADDDYETEMDLLDVRGGK